MMGTRSQLGLTHVKNVCNTQPMNTTSATIPAGPANLASQLETFATAPAAILDEARGWIMDCWEDVDAWDMSESELGRIIARHYAGGIPEFLTNSAALTN